MQRLLKTVLLTTLWLTFFVPRGEAQNCAYADIFVDATVALDESAICDAAEPLADAGYLVFVYMTDYAPDTEDQWFARLDDVESQVGLRNNDGFTTNAFALEASLTADDDWAKSVTFGEDLYDSNIDSDTSTNQIKQRIISGIQNGNVTDGFVNALTLSADLLDINTSSTSNSQPATPSQTTESTGSGLGTAVVAIVGLGAIGAAGAYAYPRYIKPAQAKRKREEEQRAYLKTIQDRVANLLLALEQLIGGDTTKDSVLYQLFEAYNGPAYEEVDGKVTEWLTDSQAALTDVFAVRSKLQEPEVVAKLSLEEQIGDWERIYVTLVGSQERILNLSDKELHTLLDPLLVLEKKPEDSKLASQLDALNQQLEGVPLKLDLQQVDPSTMDEDGILGTLDAVQAEIGRLQAAQTEAPEALEKTRKARLEAEAEDADVPFVVAEASRYMGIDQRLDAAESLIIEGLHLRAIEEIEYAEDLLEVVAELREFESTWADEQQEIAAIEAEGYIPPTLAATRKEIADDSKHLSNTLHTGDPDTALTWLTELENDSDTAVAAAIDWRELALDNAKRLGASRSIFATVFENEQPQSAEAWEQLQGYPNGNWEDLSTNWAGSKKLLTILPKRLDAIEKINQLDLQRFVEAERELSKVEQEVAAARVHIEAVANRLDEVISAENNIDSAIDQAENAIRSATRLRNAEDAKITPAIDAQIAEAHALLDRAKTTRDARNFIAAMHAQSHSYEMATTAKKESETQVAKINDLQRQVNEWIDTRAKKLDATLQTLATRDIHKQTSETLNNVRAAQKLLSVANQQYHIAEGQEDHALAEQLGLAITTFGEAERQVTAIEKAVEEEQAHYDAQFRKSTQAVQRAEQAILRAYQEGRRGQTGSQWRVLAERAKAFLPNEPSPSRTKLAQLIEIEKEADKAWQIAKDAERSAENMRRRNRQRAIERTTRRTVIGGGGSSWGGGSSGWGGSSSSSSRRRSSSTRRSSSSSSRSSSRRSGSSSRGSSRRSSSSSRGSSRRR